MTRQAKVVRPTNTGGHSKVGHKITLVFESCGGATVRPCGQSRQYLQSLHSVANEAETNILGDTSPSPVPLQELKNSSNSLQVSGYRIYKLSHQDE